ncbi:unnamed protein product [Brassicogethes aeneus]|uniref:RanBD1 domain-containing protein n=1 Tax=Brassicogethes aeneus TaxID=1431903 RepID=A0A9P0B4F3_BRAAE|nr:unnamed protein product [Brassicogethes aeneus]
MAESQQNSDGLKSESLNPPIIMKIDAPKEDTHKIEDEDNDKNEIESFRMCTPTYKSVISSPNLFSGRPKSLIKPPQLSFNKPASKTFVLNPSKLAPVVPETNSEQCDKKVNQANGETPKFVPLVQTESRTTNISAPSKSNSKDSATVSSSTSFVFGQNLSDRVIAGEREGNDEAPSTSLHSNGSSEMLFSSVMNTEVKPDSTNKESKSLSESAREYEESRASKRKYDEVEVKTGEEEETNVISISCKLFAYDKTGGSWQERGRGTLRLNDLEMDDNQTQSRLVFRTSGSLRVILNTKIWAEMTVEKASEKSIRITALDSNGEIKVFLIMGTIEDSKQFFNQLQSRVQKEVLASQKRRKPLTNADTDSGGQ